jgi:hypothetical protein
MYAKVNFVYYTIAQAFRLPEFRFQNAWPNKNLARGSPGGAHRGNADDGLRSCVP